MNDDELIKAAEVDQEYAAEVRQWAGLSKGEVITLSIAQAYVSQHSNRTGTINVT